MKKVWIVGSSSGIGLELVKLWLVKNDYLIIASSTSIQNNILLKQLQEKYPSKLKLLNIDVTNDLLIKSVVEKALGFFDGIDMFFYNAGVYEITNMKKIELTTYESMINVNYLGVVRILKYLMPYLLKKSHKSKIVINASLASYFGLPNAGAYSASKSALVSFAQSIQPELKAKNIEVQIINHGFVKTKLTEKNSFKMPQLMECEYAAIIINQQLVKPYHFEIKFPFILSKFLQLLSLLPYKFSLALCKKMIN